jgi:hypothetical protein
MRAWLEDYWLLPVMLVICIGCLWAMAAMASECEAQGKHWHCYDQTKPETCHCLERAP